MSKSYRVNTAIMEDTKSLNHCCNHYGHCTKQLKAKVPYIPPSKSFKNHVNRIFMCLDVFYSVLDVIRGVHMEHTSYHLTVCNPALLTDGACRLHRAVSANTSLLPWLRTFCAQIPASA